MTKAKLDREVLLEHLRVTCRTCGWTWIPRVAVPQQCANPVCHTPYWNRPYERSGWEQRMKEKRAGNHKPVQPKKTKPADAPASVTSEARALDLDRIAAAMERTK